MTVRLDLFMKKTYLLKRRELARELCDEGMVRVNEVPRKASFEVKTGDLLEFPVYHRLLRVRVLGIPAGNVAKADQWSYVEVLEEKRLTLDDSPLADPFGAPSKPPTQH